MEPRRSVNKLDTRVQAFNLMLARSFSRGAFTLASGKKSDFYLDLRRTSLHPEGASLIASLVVQYIKDRELAVDLVGGLEMGAVPLVAAVAMASHATGRPLPAFVVRKATKDHGLKKKIETAEDLAGKNVLVLDDVTTSGGSAMQAVAAAREAGAKVLLVLSIVDRGEGAEDFYRKENIPFDRLFHIREFLAATGGPTAG